MSMLAPGRLPGRFACSGCEGELGFDFTMAFQPIVDVAATRVWGHEALVRGLNGAGAGTVLAQVTDANRFAFDQRARVRAVELASRIGLPGLLSINFMPNAVYEPARCLRTTLDAAERTGFPVERIMFEVTEDERVRDRRHLKRILATYREFGLRTAIDDFGAGFSGLSLLADFQPDVVKIDMDLTRGIHGDRVRQAIVRTIVSVCRELAIEVIAEGLETADEMTALCDLGVGLMQGFLFARPAVEAAPEVWWPRTAA